MIQLPKNPNVRNEVIKFLLDGKTVSYTINGKLYKVKPEEFKRYYCNPKTASKLQYSNNDHEHIQSFDSGVGKSAAVKVKRSSFRRYL